MRTGCGAPSGLGIAWEHDLQDLVLEHHWLLTATNWIYVYGHWPVIAACGIALYTWRRERYVLLRNAMFISGLIGFAFFAAFPVAPPRLADRDRRHGHGVLGELPGAPAAGADEQVRSLPSLHAGWNLLVGIVLFQATTRHAVRAFALAMPLAMAYAVVATANHFTLDVVAGARRPRGARGGELLGRTYNRPRG